jgi:HK97 family phage major capsid protein
MRSLPLYLLALIIAIANTPLDIFQINAWGHGTERLSPWRRRLKDAVQMTRLRSLARTLMAWCRGSGGLVAATAALLIIALLVVPHVQAHSGVMLATVPLVGLKGYRQRDADLKKEVAQAKKDRAAIGEKALTENRALTAEEKEKFVAAGASIEALEARLSDNGDMLRAAEEANEAERVAAAGVVRVDADAEAANAAARAAGHQTLVVGESAEDKMRKAPGFFGSALHAVRRVAMHEAKADDLKIIRMMGGPTGANTDVPSDAGFLVAPNQAGTIIQRAYDTGEILKLVTRQPIGEGFNGITLPAIDETSRADGSRYGGIASAWVGQGVGTTAGRPKFRLMDLKLKKILAFVYGTDELNQDAVAFEAWVNRNLPLELSFRIEDAVVNGDGSNKPVGLLNSGAAVTVTRNTASRVFYEDVSGMWKRMWAPLRKTSVWLIDQSVEQDLEQMSIGIGTAGVLAPIYKPAGISVGPDGTQGYSPATLYGRPILTTEYGANIGTVGDIILTNLGEYTLIDKGGVQQAVSMHVAFLTDENVYRFTYRADGQLNWSAALTPKSGGASLSPVVTLT